jgi:hypothetical protein
LLAQAADCLKRTDPGGCRDALVAALPLLAPVAATPATEPQRATDQMQAAAMALSAGNSSLALRYATALLAQASDVLAAADAKGIVLTRATNQ